jgi:hypothetical protein
MQENIKDLPGWKGSINHEDAEKLLLSKEPGTYLLRLEDPITESIKENLKKANDNDIECYVLTIVEEFDKIEDILLIKMKDKWLLFHDDPDLKDNFYHQFNSLKDILESLKTKAKYPL